MGRQKRYGLIAAPLVLFMFSVPARAALLGDVNGDGRVNVQDVVQVLRFAVNLELPTDAQRILADVYPNPGTGTRTVGDGRIDVNDAVRILRYAAGVIDANSFGASRVYLVLVPGHVVLGPLDQLQFTAVPVGYDAAVKWSLTSTLFDPGQLGSDGTYTAPREVVTGSTVTVNGRAGALEGTAQIDLTPTGSPPPPP